MKLIKNDRAFTLVELLVAITVLGTLLLIVVPAFDGLRENARRTDDRSKIRQIGQAALVYADDHQGNLPPKNLNQNGIPTGSVYTTTVTTFAAALAHSGGLNDGRVWISASDLAGNAQSYDGGPILRDTDYPRLIRPEFISLVAISFGVVSGLQTSDPATAPIAFTRGINPIGRWVNDRTTSVYGQEGGHIVFLGGDVAFYKDALGEDGRGIFIHATTGNTTIDIRQTLKTSHALFSTRPFTSISNHLSTGG